MYAKEIKTQTSLRVDTLALKEAKKILDEVGMNFSEAVNIFTKMIVKYKGLPFEVRIPNRETLEAFKRVDSQPKLKSFTLNDFESFLDEYKSR